MSAAREWLTVYVKGIFMGAADAVPGVSGGTIALITGIYERLIGAITSLDPRALRYLPRLHRRTERAEFRATLAEMDIPFLLALGTGIVTAIVSVARLVDIAREVYPGPLFAFFFGLIAASAIILYDQVSLDTPRRVMVAVFGFAFAFALSGGVSNAAPNSPLVVFVAGSIAIAGMILPGVSGAFFLLLLGQYTYLTGVLSDFVGSILGLVTGGSLAAVIGPGIVVVAFCAGALIGLFSIAYAIRWALANYREATLTFLVSLMVGALRLPATKVLENTPAATPMAVGSVVAVAVAGGALVVLVDRFTGDIEFA